MRWLNYFPIKSCFARNLKAGLFIVSLISSSFIAAQERVIRLYDGMAVGSETWDWKEGEVVAGPPMNARIAFNITNPTLVVFEPAKPSGTAVIVCPGGSYHVLNIEHEGSRIAKELNKKGITVFVFKYRLVQSFTNDPWQEMMETRKNPESLRQKMEPLRTMAMEDLNKAVAYVRKHAQEFNIDTSRIGVMGFSAGGFLAANLAYNYTSAARPDFVAPIYCVITNIKDRSIKPDAPPLFIAAATDDALAPVINSIHLYTDWITAKKSAELHLYANGGHGMRSKYAATWLDRFVEWLSVQGLLKSNQ